MKRGRWGEFNRSGPFLMVTALLTGGAGVYVIQATAGSALVCSMDAKLIAASGVGLT